MKEILQTMWVAAKELGRERGEGSDCYCDLSGEWADRPNLNDIENAIYERAGVVEREDWMLEFMNDLIESYEQSYNEAADPTVTAAGDSDSVVM